MVENVSCSVLTAGPGFNPVVFMVEKVALGAISLQVRYNSNYPDSGYPDRLGSSGKFVANSTQLTPLEITGCRIKYSTVLWFL